MNKSAFESSYPLTPAQAGSLYQARCTLPEHSTVLTQDYLFQVPIRIRGKLDVDRFERAWERTTQLHAILRTGVDWSDPQKPFQSVANESSIEFERHSFANTSPEDQSNELDRFLTQDRNRGIDLSGCPLFRLSLLEWGPTDHHLVITYFMVVDTWSLVVIWNDAVSAYLALKGGEEYAPEKRSSMAEFVSWLKVQDREKAKNYWAKELGGVRGPSGIADTLASSFTPTPATRAYDNVIRAGLGDEGTASMRELARSCRTTPFVLVQAAWGILLSRYLDRNEVVWGAEYAVRPVTLDKFDQMTGFFVNGIPMRAELDGNGTVKEYLRAVGKSATTRFRYAHCGLSDIQSWANAGTSPLFSHIVVNFTVGAAPRNAPGEIETDADLLQEARLANHWSVLLGVEGVGQGAMGIKAFYDPRRFTTGSMEQMIGHLTNILGGMQNHLERPLDELPMLSEEEKTRVVSGWNETSFTFEDAGMGLHQLFERTAKRTPSATAVVFQDQSLTYGQLNEQASLNAIALARTGISGGSRVALLCERGPDLAVGVLAILKAGASYVPVASDWPSRRIEYVLETAEVSGILVSSPQTGLLPKTTVPIVVMDTSPAGRPGDASCQLPDRAIEAMDEAYVIFTSGSTGQPKGVSITHHAAANTLFDINRRFEIGASDRVLALSSLGFDLSVFDFFGMWAAGGCVVIDSATSRDPSTWLDSVQRHKVTVWNTVPALLEMLVEYARGRGTTLDNLRVAMVSGDWCPVSLPMRTQEVAPKVRMYVLGGATEASIWSNFHDGAKLETHWRTIPYGRPLANQRFYVLDNAGRPLPPLVAGELCIGGVGVAQGYVNRPELTDAQFKPDPFVAGGRIYRTGDLGRFLTDGTIEFLGRRDAQVKVGGYRIELEEIEASAERVRGVQRAIAAVREHATGARDIVLGVVWESGGELSAVDQQLAEDLPPYMLPKRTLSLTELPLSANGKLDRPGLVVAVEQQRAMTEVVSTNIQAPTRLAEIWAEVLEVDQISEYSDFFECGGDSLRATQLISRVAAEFGVELPLAIMFQARTVTEMELEISRRQRDDNATGTTSESQKPALG